MTYTCIDTAHLLEEHADDRGSESAPTSSNVEELPESFLFMHDQILLRK